MRGCVQLQWISFEDSFDAFVPAHTMLNIQFVTKNGMTPMLHPLYSPDLTWVTFLFVSPWMKKVLKGKHLADVEEVKQKMVEALKGIKIDEFKNCFEQ